MSDTQAGSIVGRLFDIQRFCIHDGPGIRTTVFLKGCPLRCVWCHNPEGISPEPALSFQPEKCIGCGYCSKTCRNGAHRMADEKHILDRDVCVACGACTAECYANALEIVGREVSVGEVVEEVLRDRPFYETSNGGMTLSGGEPLMQIDFTEALLRAARKERLHCCVDTCGFGEFSRLERILPHVDLFLYDIKDTDNGRHVEFTGVPNPSILENLRALHDRGAAVRLRLPIIPGCNDRADHFEAAAELANSLPNLEGVEIMPYHRLGVGKLGRLGMNPEDLLDCESPPRETIAKWIGLLTERGVELVNEAERPDDRRRDAAG